MRTFEGDYDARELSFGIAVSRFNGLITEALLSGALGALRRHGADPDRIDVVWVPGAFELPWAIGMLARSGRYDALIALGAVVRGATAHFDYVAGGAASGIQNVIAATGVPVAFGVLTTDTLEQAFERAGTKAGNAGERAAMTAIELASLRRKLGTGQLLAPGGQNGVET
ncbi:6,7-dimethyl-8-ribityllumazine synthase [Hydrogenibacillus sp. N12]|uniref:6,7-dimethyl-8-ribityllumazine synthase n=1 Tax=Hydrogenibacillus sp. N12 TaxID=2866627 RepID=UPI001C7CE297|nr:6,7-dimethyl-8-ribityllumazine synthase [Hydrogenibacillus sp. N12]QZA32992.1 6,7-dimethyl-8-ribityllumazine synthase [Hydrogenibacillus sp. N12]